MRQTPDVPPKKRTKVRIQNLRRVLQQITLLMVSVIGRRAVTSSHALLQEHHLSTSLCTGNRSSKKSILQTCNGTSTSSSATRFGASVQQRMTSDLQRCRRYLQLRRSWKTKSLCHTQGKATRPWNMDFTAWKRQFQCMHHSMVRPTEKEDQHLCRHRGHPLGPTEEFSESTKQLVGSFQGLASP